MPEISRFIECVAIRARKQISVNRNRVTNQTEALIAYTQNDDR